MASFVVRKDGYISGKTDKNNVNSVAIQYLEDGLSYLNYAKNKSDRGTGNPEEDYKIGKEFILSALNELLG